ncbi:hypothetical protein GYMLUDRAFT_50834 [Collybiopsis luxurians FD-317 M1]|uniref:Uncharacterized protein n=1 Tax=Collybiopsis luxurians FD-317 M1 TaxID=944289 RepID=A0A0D0ALI8_9AGAR|nr:hypothetical protein GYMLUDRAFT_50834 [Collybiopsis luxurians FD-317 M1]
MEKIDFCPPLRTIKLAIRARTQRDGHASHPEMNEPVFELKNIINESTDLGALVTIVDPTQS